MFRKLALAALIALFAPTVSADDAATRTIGPAIGSPAPATTLKTYTNTPMSLNDLSGDKGLVLVFFRSASWCPFCKKQLAELQGAEADLADWGWQLAGVSYDSPEILASFAETTGLSYPLLSDADSTTIRNFDLLNDDVDPDSRAYGIPHPAIVFIDSSGVVVSVLQEEGYRNRPQVETVLATADALTQ
ncbi:MAG: peroxiredoxin family protein [Pseudomonadota bacterium]